MIYLYTKRLRELDMFYLLRVMKRRTFGRFLMSSDDKLFFIKKETCPPKRVRMVTLPHGITAKEFGVVLTPCYNSRVKVC